MDAAFFDLDGCLVDSGSAIAGAINHALGVVGLPAQPERDLHPLIGPPLLGIFEGLLPALGGDVGDARAAVAAYREVYGDLAARRTVVIDGVPEVLDRLRGSLHLAVVTSKPRVSAIPILEALGLRPAFVEVYGPDLDALTEPKAVQLARAVTDAGVPASRSTMVGDRGVDVEAAVAVGARSVGVTWGSGDRAELRAAGADHVVDRPADLVGLLAP